MSESNRMHLLRWKGRQSGPYDLDEIQAKLAAGEISLVHQIQVRGGWQLLDDFLGQMQPPAPAPDAAVQEVVARPVRLRSAEAASTALLPSGSAFSEPPERHSRLAVAALVAALALSIPYLRYVAWIVALACGHLALAAMNRDDSLRGRGLAIAGLAITYFLLIVGVTFAILMLATNQKVSF